MILTPWVSYKKQELPSLRDQMSSLRSFWWDVCCLSFLFFYGVCFVCFCLFVFVCLFVCLFILFIFVFVSCLVRNVAWVSGLSIPYSPSVFFNLYLGICVCLMPHFSDISIISYVGGQYYLLRKPEYPMKAAYSTRKLLSHEDVSVIKINHKPSLGITKNLKMNQSNKTTNNNKQPNN